MRNAFVRTFNGVAASIVLFAIVGCSTKTSADEAPSQPEKLVEVVTPTNGSGATNSKLLSGTPKPVPHVLPTMPENTIGNGTNNNVSPAVPLPKGCPEGPVFVVGDSLTDPAGGGAGAYLPEMFTRMGVPVSVYGLKGMSTETMLNGKYGDTIGSVEAIAAKTWIVAMGTNDSENGFANKIGQVLRHAGTRNVYWVNIVRPNTSIPGPAQKINESLVNATKTYPKLHIIDYVSAVAANPTMLGPDGIHLASGEAYRWRAQLYVSPWNACT